MRREWSATTRDRVPPPDCADPPEYIAYELAVIAASDKFSACELTLVQTTPATVAGAAAMLRYALEIIGRDGGDLTALGETRVPYDDDRDTITNHAETMLETLAAFLEARSVQS